MKYWIHFFLINFLFILSASEIVAQAVQDSTYWSDEELERELYEINLTNFKRFLSRIDFDSTLTIQVSRYSTEFIQLAKSGNYSSANVILESLLTALQERSFVFPEEDDLTGIDDDEPQVTSNFQWLNAITIGSDSWKQQFDLSIPENDSTIIEENYNPSLQFQLGFRYDQINYHLKMNGHYKSSRDYDNGMLSFDYARKLSDKFHVNFTDQFDHTSYKEEIDLTYWQNGVSADFQVKSLGPCSVDLSGEFLVRKNQPESSGYSDFYQSQVRLNNRYRNGTNILLGADYQWENKWYPVYLEKDYQEHQLGVNGFSLIGWRLNLYGYLTYRIRDYTSAFNDTTFYNDYNELAATVNSTYRLSNLISVRLDAVHEHRRYGHMNAVTTDYFENKIEPSLVFYFKESWEFRLGYIFDSRNYSDMKSNDNLIEEDYYSHGISLSVDLLQLNRFILSLNDTYTYKRYPNSAANEIESFNLYTDRNTNSIMLLFSWNVTQHLELGILANYDTDKDPYEEHSDTQSTLFSIELSYLF